MSSALTDPRECQKVKAVMPGNHFLLISLSWTQLLPRPEKTFLEKNNTRGYQVAVLSFAWSVVLHSEAPAYTKT